MPEDKDIIEEITDIVKDEIQKSLTPIEFPDSMKVEVLNPTEIPKIDFSGLEKAFREFANRKREATPQADMTQIENLLEEILNLKQPDNSKLLGDILKAIDTNKPLPADFTGLSDQLTNVVEELTKIRKKPVGHGGVSSKRVILDKDGKVINPATLESTTHQKTAFGELSVAEPSPIAQIQFPYNLNTDIIEIRDNNGTASVVNNMANLSTGAGANQSSTILSKTPIKYNPGQGALVRFTALYTTGIANSTQYAGIGNTTDGYFFGYNGATFGILRRQGGLPETQRLRITTASNTNEDITITLNGVAETVAVTATGGDTVANRVQTANEIAAHDFSNVGEGWEVHNMGADVFFTSYSGGAKSGTYSLVNGGGVAAGTFAQSLAGVSSTETIVVQTDWNEDTFDGTGGTSNPSKVTLDPTKGNVFQIRYQWLGFGAISFFIEHGKDGDLHLVHMIEFANLNTAPSVDNPTIPLFAQAKNKSNTSDIVLRIGSMAGFVEGRDILPGLPHSVNNTVTGISNIEVPILTIHSHDIYQGTINRVKIKLIAATISVEGNKTSIIRVRKNAVLTGPVDFNALDSEISTIHFDIAATGVSGGVVINSSSGKKIDTVVIDLEKLSITLVAPEFLTITVQGTAVASIEAVASLNLQELF